MNQPEPRRGRQLNHVVDMIDLAHHSVWPRVKTSPIGTGTRTRLWTKEPHQVTWVEGSWLNIGIVCSLVHFSMTLPITVCAVAQHCYNGDVSFLWEKWKL